MRHLTTSIFLWWSLVALAPAVAPAQEAPPRPFLRKVIQFDDAQLAEVEKKKAEMKEELEAAAALAHRYVPPDPGLMQVVMNAGKASLAQQGPGVVALKFPDYQKAGDALTLTFDTSVKALRQMGVATYLDDPSSPVTLQVQMAALPDASYPAAVTLAIPGSQIAVRITRSNYQRLAQ